MDIAKNLSPVGRIAAILACLLLLKETPAMSESAENTPVSTEHARLYAPGPNTDSQEPIRPGPGPHLFIDDYLIASSDGVARVVNVPGRDEAIPNPIVTGKEDGCFQPYMTIVRDTPSGRFRMWFGHRTEDFNGGRSRIGYLESDDGIHWEKPPRLLDDPAPIQFGVSVIDDGPETPNPDQRYKYAWWMDGGLKVATSPDGLAWTPMTEQPVILHNHDINGMSYDPVRERYVATVSVYRGSDTWSGNRRITMHSHSTDLKTWSTPHHVIVPDPAVEDGEVQFYAMDGYLQRGELTIGMVKVLRDDLKADDPPDPPEAYGMGYTTLAWTRDGETWFRDTTPFFSPHPQKGEWDHAHAWIDDQVLVDDELFLYYGGYARGHKVGRFEERQIGLVKMKRDRYVARKAEGGTGRISTPLLILGGDSLTVNVDAQGGSLRVQVLDAGGKAIPGLALEDCQPITSDALAAPVAWKRPLAELKDKPVRLEFVLEKASLFGFGL
jgi:hypothetical protein